MYVEDIVIRKRPSFGDDKLQESMENTDWDNEKGKGILSEEDVKTIAEAIVLGEKNEDTKKDNEK